MRNTYLYSCIHVLIHVFGPQLNTWSYSVYSEYNPWIYLLLSCAQPGGDSLGHALRCKVVERVAAAELELSTYREREGVFTRPSVVLNAKKMAPAAWWSQYGKHLPILSGVATRKQGPRA